MFLSGFRGQGSRIMKRFCRINLGVLGNGYARRFMGYHLSVSNLVSVGCREVLSNCRVNDH